MLARSSPMEPVWHGAQAASNMNLLQIKWLCVQHQLDSPETLRTITRRPWLQPMTLESWHTDRRLLNAVTHLSTSLSWSVADTLGADLNVRNLTIILVSILLFCNIGPVKYTLTLPLLKVININASAPSTNLCKLGPNHDVTSKWRVLLHSFLACLFLSPTKMLIIEIHGAAIITNLIGHNWHFQHL